MLVDYAQYEPLALDMDRRRIEAYYRRRGFFSAKVTNVEIGKAGEGISVRFIVEEGRPSILAGVILEGAPPPLDAVMRGLAAELTPGAPFDYGSFEEVKAKMRQTLVSEGYVHAEIGGRAEVDRDRHEVRAFYSIDSGPAVRVGAISVEGLELLPEDFVRDRLALGTNDRFDPEELDVTRARILETGLAESVRFGWDREKRGETLDLVVGIAEGPRNELRFGAGFGRSNGYEVRTLASYTRKSLFFDPLSTFRFTLKPSWEFFFDNADKGGPSIEASAELEKQDLFYPRLVGTLGVDYRFVQLEAYTTNGPSVGFGAGMPFFDDRSRFGVRVQYDHFSINPRFEPELAEDVLRSAGMISPLRVLGVSFYLSYDGRDDPLDPRFGVFADLRYEIGQAFGLGAYSLITPDVRGYVPLFWERLVLAGRVRFGATGFADETLPVSRRYFAGGPESQRGFGRRRLAPFLGAEALPVGGEALFETSAELRLDLFQLFGQWFGIVGFVDAADATNSIAEIDLLRLHWAAGGGLRYRTPIGPIRIDVGFRLNRRGTGEPDAGKLWALHFSLGEAF